MAAKYDFKSNPFVKDGEKQVLYPSIVVSGTKTTDDIVADISTHSSFSPGCVEGVLTELTNYIIHHLREGYNVKIDDLGSFSVTLASRPVTDKSEIRSASVDFDKVCFRATPDLVKYVRSGARLERAHYGFSESASGRTKEERLAMLKDYLGKHDSISRLAYCELTGLLRSTASRELEAWSEAGIIVKHGRYANARFELREG